jgi:hypothetical protein
MTTTKKKKALKAKKTQAQEALEVTWVLMGQLKRAQLTYLFIGEQLKRVRDEKLYAALHHADMEAYAQERLGMRRSSLYKYLQVYEWVAEFHKEWLDPKPKGFIPELNDVTDLMWIERKLKEKGLTSQTRKELETMRKAALEGSLRDSDLEEWRGKGGRIADGFKTALSGIRSVRKRCAKVQDMPSDAISHLDAAIEIIKKMMEKEKA